MSIENRGEDSHPLLDNQAEERDEVELEELNDVSTEVEKCQESLDKISQQLDYYINQLSSITGELDEKQS
ncbi:MAG: hypothetical protein EZS28_025179 [Streblomastix strix]|uniref:Uncharacterized protein n=1 Tax=Streblomastix strix TaxID=222440 RepID=A0A5J4V9V1_9EUKA|nr:MAG: hypothetical protein EZS28_025179 [Streblomastix strix]